MYTTESIKASIEKGLSRAQVTVTNPQGDGEHFEAEVIWDGFEGMTMIEQHRVVYDTLKEEFDEGLHALGLKTKVKND